MTFMTFQRLTNGKRGGGTFGGLFGYLSAGGEHSNVSGSVSSGRAIGLVPMFPIMYTIFLFLMVW